MHINMKYYVVSIGAIFISLGIGMLVGFNLNYDQELTKQQEEMIGELNLKFEDLRELNNKLEDDIVLINNEYENSISFINSNVDKIIEDKLLNKSIGIISTNQDNDFNQEIADTLSKSGANIAFDIVLLNNIFEEEKLKELSKNLSMEFKSSKDVINYIVECLKTSDAKSNLSKLQEFQIINIRSISDNYDFESIVLAGGNNGKLKEKLFNNLDKNIIEKLRSENKHIVGVQRSDSKYSYINLYFNEKVTSVDNIDEGIGKISMVMLLEDSNILGKFGRTEDSDNLIPYKKE
mgnify:FL=1